MIKSLRIAGLTLIATATVTAMSCLPGAAMADTFETIESAPLNQVWLNGGFHTWHFQSNKDLNGANGGLGAEWRFSTVASATVGRFYNSDRAYSNYLGVYYQPWKIGPVRIGAVLGAFDGYPRMRNGGWFPAAIPTLSYEYKRVGVNIGIIPSYKDRLYGGISVQLKVQAF